MINFVQAICSQIVGKQIQTSSPKWMSVFYFIHFAYIGRMELDRVKYWTNVSDYDLETAEAMYSTGRWLYVGFMCHQTLEKIFKAYWCSKKEENAPMSHNLLNIAQACGLNALFSSEQIMFISEIMPLNIEARYPSYKEAVGKGLNQEKCQELVNKTRELQQWIKDRL